MPHLVRAASLTHYAEIARSVGLDPGRMMAASQLHPSCLENPDLRISVEAAADLLERSAALSGVEAFGLLMAEGRRISNLGFLGLMMREQPSLRMALQAFEGYGRLHNDALIQKIEESQNIATIREHMLLDSHKPTRQATELVIGIAVRLMRLFLGPSWKARRICFTHAEPSSMAVHIRVLGQTPEFGSEFNGVVCSSADLDTQIATADPTVARLMRTQLESDAKAHARTSDEVREMAVVLLPRGRCTSEQVAKLMGFTSRTLYTHLAKEGTSFGEIVREVRRHLCTQHIQEDRLSLTAISQILGFQDLSSFSRWHRSEFGASAAQLRK